jgi:catechol 2,3-dioxygenase-like lactoylglutathione lyase family enzyme
MRMAATVLGAPDARALASFYRRLLGWTVADDEPDWVRLTDPDGGAGLSFQSEPDHAAPTWPTTGGEQQMMMHLDIAVEDLAEAVTAAQSLGARLADWQPQERVRVLIDPAGHPFCLFEAGA